MLRLLGIAFVALAAALTISWCTVTWLDAGSATSKWSFALSDIWSKKATEPTEFDEVANPFLYGTSYNSSLLSPRFIAIYEPLIPDKAKLRTQLRECNSALKQAHPHLKESLENPTKTPFLQKGAPLLGTERQRLERIAELLLEDYLENSRDSLEEREAKKATLQLALTDTIVNQNGSPDSPYFKDIVSSSDPVFLFAAARMVPNDPTPSEWSWKAYESLDLRPTSPYLRLHTIGMLVSKKLPQDEKLNRLYEEYCDALADLLSDPNTPREMLIAGQRRLRSADQDLTSLGMLMLCKTLATRENPPCPEWAVKASFGYLLRRISSDYRGTTQISSVSKEDMENFEKYGELAIRFLLDSWSLQPDNHPLVAELMSVEGQLGGTGRSIDEWLRYAIQLNPTDEQVFFTYTNYSLPRWGGSDEKLAWFAGKIAEGAESTGNLEMASLFWIPVLEYGRDDEYSLLYNNRQLTRSALNIGKVIKANPQLATGEDCKISSCFYGAMCAILWDSNLFQELNWFMGEYDAQCTSSNISVFKRDHSLMKRGTKVANRQTKLLWSELISRLYDNSVPLSSDAIPEVELLIDQIEAKSELKESEAIRMARKSLDILKSFHSGKPTLLSFDPDMLLWKMSDAVLFRSDTEAVYNFDTSQQYFSFEPSVCFSPPYRISVVLQDLANVPDPKGFYLNVGADITKGSFHPGAVLALSFTKKAVFWRARQSAVNPVGRAGQFADNKNPFLIGFKVDGVEVTALSGTAVFYQDRLVSPITGSFAIRRSPFFENSSSLISNVYDGPNPDSTSGSILISQIWIEKDPTDPVLPILRQAKEDELKSQSEDVDAERKDAPNSESKNSSSEEPSVEESADTTVSAN